MEISRTLREYHLFFNDSQSKITLSLNQYIYILISINEFFITIQFVFFVLVSQLT